MADEINKKSNGSVSHKKKKKKNYYNTTIINVDRGAILITGDNCTINMDRSTHTISSIIK